MPSPKEADVQTEVTELTSTSMKPCRVFQVRSHTLSCFTYWENKSEVGFSKYTSSKDRSLVRDPVASWKGTASKEMLPHNPTEGMQIAVTVSVNTVGADTH